MKKGVIVLISLLSIMFLFGCGGSDYDDADKSKVSKGVAEDCPNARRGSKPFYFVLAVNYYARAQKTHARNYLRCHSRSVRIDALKPVKGYEHHHTRAYANYRMRPYTRFFRP